MQTNLVQEFLDHPEGPEAERILRNCVHCGFCNATCPTYQLLGNELDGPRGRIYLIKQVLEGHQPTARSQLHLDRCLTCRNCETTCPSGVEYSRLLEIGRSEIERRVPRPLRERLLRAALLRLLPYRRRFSTALRLGQSVRPLLPAGLRRLVPERVRAKRAQPAQHARRVLLPAGCVQPALAPQIDQAAIRVLDRLGINAVQPDKGGCCGAINLHLGQEARSLDFMRRNIDAWWPAIEQGVEAIVVTATGCGVTVRDYGRLLAHDTRYAQKASRVTALAKDLSELLADEPLHQLARPTPKRIAFHAPCTLQHGMKLPNRTEQILQRAGFELSPVPDAHLCCGSAGTYSILQPELSRALGERKVQALESGAPEAIATANIGCLMEIRKRSALPVLHWIELFDPEPS